MPSLQETFDCERPVALVTGSGSPRVGRAIALELASHGCDVVVHANTNVEQAKLVVQDIQDRIGREAIAVTGSLAEDTVPEQLVKTTVERFGRIDILVNSAAIWHPKKLESVTAADLRRYFDINAIGTFQCARAAGMEMASRHSGGSIVNLGDWATVRPYLDHAAYFPSKGAVETMTRSLAVELGTRNPKIRVNCVQPGPVLFGADVDDETKRKVAASTIRGESGTPEHVAHAVRFLCENDFINGICLPVDGGRSIYAPDGLQVGLNLG